MANNINTFFISILLSCIPVITNAHDSRPLYIEIIENSKGIFEICSKIPPTVHEFNLPEVSIAIDHTTIDHRQEYRIKSGFVKKQTIGVDSVLNGTEIQIKYPVLNPSLSTLIRIQLLTGEVYNQLLSPKETSWTIPQSVSQGEAAKQYAILGIRHILEGWDHLLFLVCLLFIAGTGKKMLITVTGFTIAHSITLVLSALNILQVPVPPVEAMIALSVLFLASEISKGDKNSLTYKYPIAVSASFGLLHGFGFASVLAEIGLPQTQIPISLLFFNVGVELGQIIFLLSIIVLIKLFSFLNQKNPALNILLQERAKISKITIYLVGSLASFWMIQRLWEFA